MSKIADLSSHGDTIDDVIKIDAVKKLISIRQIRKFILLPMLDPTSSVMLNTTNDL